MPAGTERESMNYDVVIVGGGPAGLAAAIRLKQCAAAAKRDLGVCLIDKGAEIGAHSLSGALIDPSSLFALLPDWKRTPETIGEPVRTDRFCYLTRGAAIALPECLQPPLMRNRGAGGIRIASLGRLCRRLAQEAETLGVEIYPGFAAADILTDETGTVTGILTGDFGRARDGGCKPSFAPGMALTAKYTLFAEGARGFLSERLIRRFALRRDGAFQKYGLGIKELWRLAPDRHRSGSVLHTMGWPLDDATGGGLFAYHFGAGEKDTLCALGMVVHLDYRNPHLSPFGEFQRAKTHPLLRRMLEGGERIGYGARTVAEGGWQSLPDLTFPGGALIGDAAGMLNLPRIKGIHNAVASGMLAAEAAAQALAAGRAGDALGTYDTAVRTGAIARDLKPVRNVKPLWSRFGSRLGASFGGFDMWWQTLFGFSPFGTLPHTKPDHAALIPARDAAAIDYPAPDGKLTFDIPSSLYLANLSHEEDQPVHLHLTDPEVPLRNTLPQYDEPAQRYCPAGVYEIVATEDGPAFRINAANCLHCKACEIKDPAQNIRWLPPEGGSGPIYSDM